jgi:hypothetical protein
MTKTSTITPERAAQLLSYDPETGLFTWKPRGISSFDSRFANKPAGTFDSSHKGIKITLDYVSIEAHRVAYMFMMGKWPECWIDHINGIRTDNRWCNLRPATSCENQYNRRKSKNNKVGLKGVYIANDRPNNNFRAEICYNKKRKFLGYFPTAEEAHAAYCNAAKILHGEFARYD